MNLSELKSNIEVLLTSQNWSKDVAEHPGLDNVRTDISNRLFALVGSNPDAYVVCSEENGYNKYRFKVDNVECFISTNANGVYYAETTEREFSNGERQKTRFEVETAFNSSNRPVIIEQTKGFSGEYDKVPDPESCIYTRTESKYENGIMVSKDNAAYRISTQYPYRSVDFLAFKPTDGCLISTFHAERKQYDVAKVVERLYDEKYQRPTEKYSSDVQLDGKNGYKDMNIPANFRGTEIIEAKTPEQIMEDITKEKDPQVMKTLETLAVSNDRANYNYSIFEDENYINIERGDLTKPRTV